MRRLGRLVVVLVLLALVPGVAGAQTDLLRDQLAQREAQRERAERDLDEVIEQEQDARTRLAAADRQLEAVETDLAALEAELADAEGALEAARERMMAARERLLEVTHALEAAEAELDEKRQRLEARIRAAFMYGQVSFAEAFAGVKDVSDFVTTTTYVGHVLSGDKELMESVQDLVAAVEAQRVEANELRGRAEREAAEADRAAAEVEAARAEQERLVAEVEERRAEQQAALEAIREDRKAIEGHLAGLEAESDRIQAQLAEIARQQEEARRQAAEAGEALGGPLEGWVRPVPGHVTSPFGPRWGRNHNGVDLSGAIGTSVVASQPGFVVHATTGCHPTSSWGCGGGFGNYVTIAHEGGMATIYAHLSGVHVGVGQVVGAGQVVGEVGNSGNSYGPHLHFETRIEGVPHNPCAYIGC